jgi:carbon storage regulator CsrA
MLVLTRRLGESIAILNLDKKQVGIGISAPDDVAMKRAEVYKKKQR